MSKVNKGELASKVFTSLIIVGFLFSVSVHLLNVYADTTYRDYCQSVGYHHAVMQYDGVYCERTERQAVQP